MTSDSRSTDRRRSPLLLMAVAAGLCVGGNYINQPLLDEFARIFAVSPVTAATTVTVAQVTYGLGLLLLVPLGDRFDRRALSVGLMVVAAAGHLVAGFSPVFGALVVGIGVAGFFSVAAQVLMPMASELAAPSEAGKAVGTVMTGVLSGMLLARAVSGGIAEVGDAQTPYLATGAALLVCAVFLWLRLPSSRNPERIPLPAIWGSMGRLLLTEPRVRTRSLMSAATFCGVSAIFATMAHLLADGPFNLSPGAIGLVSLGGLAGILVARPVGKMVDRGRDGLTTWLGIGGLAVSWVLFFFGATSLVWFVVGFVVVDMAMQGVHVTSANVLYSLFPESRGRVNSVYMTSFFIGAAAGSALGVWAWGVAGWNGVIAVGAVSTVVAALAAVADRRHAVRSTATS